MNPLRSPVLLGLLIAVPAFAQQSGPMVSMPAHVATTDSIANIARQGDAMAFPLREFRVSRKHTMPRATAELRAAKMSDIQPLLTVPANTPYTQTANYQPLGAPVLKNFEALGVGTPGYSVSGAPPDTTLAVSPTQIVQWVNSQIGIYDKNGNSLLPAPGYLNGNQIWAALPAGSLCRQFNRGDPILQYDKFAQRWILSQFAFNADFSQNAQCIAVSTTSNALGTYNLYQYNFGVLLPDYGKLGVWTDAYYITYNMFNVGANTFNGGQACAYDRAAMIAGLPATQICFNSVARFSFLPADLDGFNLPPAGTPNFHLSWDWYNTAPPYTMQITKFKPNFAVPGLSTFDDGMGGAPFSFVGFNLGNGTLAACNDLSVPGGSDCVPQLGTATALDSLADRHMYRLVYRNFGAHDALLFTQATDNVAGVAADLRWWEIRKPGSNAPVVHQNSTYRPSGDFRWMGSAAFDKVGNIGIGYSASSPTMNPAIRIAGRRATDPRNLLRTEVTVQVGTGSQTGNLSRWGDYSTMQTDPTDDCTLWYTTQYIGSNGSFNWRTRIVAFKFPNCV